MRVAFLALLSVVACLSACAVDEAREYRITASTSRDRAKTLQVLQHVAAEAGLPSAGPSSTRGKVICMYQDPHVTLLAQRGDHAIEVQLMRSDWPPPQAFKRAERLLEPALSEAFGAKLSVTPPKPFERVIVTE